MAVRKKPFAGIEKGGFHKTLGKSPDAPITSADIAKGKAMGGKAAKQAVLAENFRKMRGSTSSTSTHTTKAASSGSAPKKKTPTQREAARKADAKRYAKDKPKRIAAEKRYQEKEKAQHPEIFKARAKVNNAVRDGRMEKPAGQDFHHDSYNSKTPKGKWMPKSKHRRLPNPKKPRTS